MSRLVAIATALIVISSVALHAQPNAQDLKRVLSDQVIWGPDFKALLINLQLLGDAGEQQVVVFPRYVQAARVFTDKQQAQDVARKTTAASANRRPTEEFLGLFRNVRAHALAMKIETVATPEGERSRITSAPQGQLLAPNLKIDIVRDRLGPPTSKKLQTLQTEGDRRPIILTTYTYSSGAVIFAESDVNPIPHAVDRVILNVPQIQSVVFLEKKQ